MEQYKGISSQEAKQYQIQYGKNCLPEKKAPTTIEIIFAQLKSPLVYILLVAAVITFFLGDYEDTVIIMISVVLNTVLGWYQENKAGKALQALKNMLQPSIQVRRDGILQTIETQDLVPGDIMLCKSGSKIAADAIVIENNKMTVSEAMLTGESLPIEKKIDESIYMGTIVLSGNALCRVDTIGAATELGKIATSLQGAETITPLQKQLHYFSKQLTWIVIAVVCIVVAIGLFRGQHRVEIFTTGVALAVGAIPEGLLVALTVVLTVGMQRILHKKGLVKNLVSAETLGGVTVICSDKTGTLTHGTMEVGEIVGDTMALYTQIARSNSDENAVAKALSQWTNGLKQSVGYDPMVDGRCKDTLPFSSEHKYSACLREQHNNNSTENMLYVSGAPEYILNWVDLETEEKLHIAENIQKHTKAGYRLIACAYKNNVSLERIEHEVIVSGGLSRGGLICLNDPVREDVKEALHMAHEAGIKLIVITGDHAGTAVAVMKQLGVAVDEDMIMTGDRLAAMSDEALDMRLETDSRVRLFARTKPEQKMRIVQALKDDGEIVAMMGDGVNDAPALKKSDIGIVVGEATEVAKESADLILLDSSFSTIIAAVEEGRAMFDNIRKIILYLLCDAFEEIILIIICILVAMPLPVTASQILRINLVSDGFPNLALTVDPKRKGLMTMQPRSPQEHIVNPWIKKLIIIVSITGAALCFLIFSWVLHLTNDIVLARSVAFVTLGINSLVYVFSVKTLEKPFWEDNILNNRRLLFAVFCGLVLQGLPFVIPSVGAFLDVVWIGKRVWASMGASVVMFAIIEVYKQATRKKTKI